MRKAIAAIAVAILCVSATASEGRWSNSIPPERFQKTGVVAVAFIPPELIAEACGIKDVPEGKVVVACTRRFKKGAPIIFMPNPCLVAEVDYYARIACHENAHAIGGWSGNHEI